MKKLLLMVVIVVIGLVAGRVEAQSTCFLPSACGTTTFTGGTLTGPLLLPDGSAAAPSLGFATEPTTGFWKFGPGDWVFQSGGVSLLALKNTAPAGELQLQATGTFGWNAGSNFNNSPDVILYRDAANTLALRNGTNAQTFNIYNTYTDGSNYERGYLRWSSNSFYIGADAIGTGVSRLLILDAVNTGVVINSGIIRPNSDDVASNGFSTIKWKEFFLSRSIQGSKSKALTESSATSFTQVAVPQTAGANYAAGEVIYTVYATDGTDSQALQGRVAFSAVNKAGTETCSIGLAYTEVLSVSTASTLTCTHTCVTGLSDVVQIASNCVSSLTQSTFTIQSRLNMPQPNTVTPQ